MATINKLGRINTTPGKIVDTLDAIIDIDYSKLKQRFLSALYSETKYTYIVTGDSTRKSGELDSSDYYAPQLAKINFELIMNSSGGQSAANWANNVGNSTLQQAIDSTPGSGDTTILEMSLGINSFGATVEEIKQAIIYGLTAYLTAKPNALIIFVSPVETGTPVNNDLDSMYKTLLASFPGSVYVSGKNATAPVHGNSNYYLDFTHPNFNGLRRLVNSVFSRTLPADAVRFMTVEDAPKIEPSNSLTFSVQNGNWYVGGGNIMRFDSSNSGRRSTTEIIVEPNFVIKLDTQGNSSFYIFSDDEGNIIESGYASYHDGSGGAFRSVTVPLGATRFGYYFASNGTEWDALNYTPVIEYLVTPTPYLKQTELNQGLLMGLPYISNSSIDSAGNLPKFGQVQQGAENGKWFWI